MLILILIWITLTIHRNETDVKILRYDHISVMLACAIIVVWSTVFLWQDDNNHYQCQSYLWAVGVPLSFIILLTNMKAYRLSTFLQPSNNRRRKLTLTHGATFTRTLLSLLVTIVFLALISGLDPPIPIRGVIDIHRPKFDYNLCKSGQVGTGLLYFVIISHPVLSIIFIVPVRNGYEAFRDGTVMKEAFIVLYAFLLIAFAMSVLGISHSSIYILRTAFVNIGVTLFMIRLLITRCSRHWISKEVAEKVSDIPFTYFQINKHTSFFDILHLQH